MAGTLYSLIYGCAVFPAVLHAAQLGMAAGAVSARDSIWTPSPFLESQMWRMEPGQPKRPDGSKDYGAGRVKVASTSQP